MQLSTTFRHMDASPAVREYAEDKLTRIKKYFQKDPISAHAVFAVERGFNHVADINITLPNGILINAKESTEDMYSSIDLAMARIERQVRKWKDKIRTHKPHGGPAVSIREMTIPGEHLEGERPAERGEGAEAAPAPATVQIVKDETSVVQQMSKEEAVMRLDLKGDELLVFIDAENQGVSVLYRRKDGNYGLIETGSRGLPNS